jgi:hypothetical protein
MNTGSGGLAACFTRGARAALRRRADTNKASGAGRCDDADDNPAGNDAGDDNAGADEAGDDQLGDGHADDDHAGGDAGANDLRP